MFKNRYSVGSGSWRLAAVHAAKVLCAAAAFGCSSLLAADVDRTFMYESDAGTFVENVPATPILIKGGTLIDGTGKEPRPNVGILIRDGLIETTEATSAPSDAIVINADGKWILPGLFDLHAHITFYLPVAFHVEDDLLNELRAERFLESYQTIGVTTVRDVASRNKVGYTLKRAQRMGLVGGARLFVSGPGITVTGGHATEFQPNEPAVYAVEADGPWMMRQRVREAVKMGADLIKVFPPFSAEEIQAVVEEADYWKLRVTAHVGGSQDLHSVSARRAVDAGVDSLEHLYPYGDDESTAQVLTDIAQKGIYVVPTVAFHLKELSSANEAYSKWLRDQVHFSMESMLKLAKDMQDAGIKFAMGTDSNAVDLLTIGSLYLAELEGLKSIGLSPTSIIQIATLNSAEAIGLEDQAGSIVAGKWGDVILVDSDPLQALKAMVDPSLVVQQGRIVLQR